jgi:hypothetical protein
MATPGSGYVHQLLLNYLAIFLKADVPCNNALLVCAQPKSRVVTLVRDPPATEDVTANEDEWMWVADKF